MNEFLKGYFFPTLLIVLLAVGCDDDDDPVIPNQEEVITDLTYTLVPTGGAGGTVVFQFQDRDGDGGQDPTMSVNGTLQPNTSYIGTIQLLNASDISDIEDVTVEVSNEADDHQFFYQTTDSLNITFDYADVDQDGNPLILGIITDVETGDSSSGDMTIILRHEPDKDAPGLTIDNPTPGGGESDIEVTFDVDF